MCCKFSFFIFLAFSPFLAPSQSTETTPKPAKKLTIYGAWGYNRFAYGKSDIHFKNNGTATSADPAHGAYDFTVYKVKANDRPDFNQIASKWSDIINITIPQFSARLGVYLNNKKDEGWEINYDHAKYVVNDGQKVRIKGTILGEQVDKDTILQAPYFHFEHTDGANFWQLNYIKRWKFYTSKNGKTNLGFIVKPGLGVVIPRTDVTLFSNRLNNCWHIAGFIAGVESGVRAELFNHLCIEFTTKAAYADYLWVLVQYKDSGRANHRFATVGSILSIGYQFHHLR